MRKSILFIGSIFVLALSLSSCYKEVTCATYTHDVEQSADQSNN